MGGEAVDDAGAEVEGLGEEEASRCGGVEVAVEAEAGLRGDGDAAAVEKSHLMSCLVQGQHCGLASSHWLILDDDRVQDKLQGSKGVLFGLTSAMRQEKVDENRMGVERSWEAESGRTGYGSLL